MTNEPTGNKNAGFDRASNDTPRWVKVFGIIAIALVVLVIVMLLTSTGHGPERHMGGSLMESTRSVAIGPVADGPTFVRAPA